MTERFRTVKQSLHGGYSAASAEVRGAESKSDAQCILEHARSFCYHTSSRNRQNFHSVENGGLDGPICNFHTTNDCTVGVSHAVRPSSTHLLVIPLVSGPIWRSSIDPVFAGRTGYGREFGVF